MTSTLDRLLVSLEVRLETFGLLEVRRGRRLVFDGLDQVIVHFVLLGQGWLEVPGQPLTPLRPGSVAVLPAKARQALLIDEGEAVDVDAATHCLMTKDGIVRFDATAGEPGDLTVLCGSLLAASRGSFGLFDGLQEPLSEAFAGDEVVADAFALIRREIAAPGFGTRAMVGAVVKICLVRLIRKHLGVLSATSPLVAALGDPRLSRAVGAVLDAPAEPHTVASLAAAAGMSRSSFAAAFSNSFAMSPMEFVAKTRLHHAAELLRTSDLPVKVVAAAIGFRAAAISRARFVLPMARIRAGSAAATSTHRPALGVSCGDAAPTTRWTRSPKARCARRPSSG